MPWAVPLVVVPYFVAPHLVGPQFAAPIAPPPRAPQSDPIEQPPPTGSLMLDVQPGAAQVFVDGYYAGTPDDLNGARGGLILEPGAHRIELTAPGYEAVSFDVRIAANQALVFRRELKSVDAPAAPPPVPKTPMTFYLIPGCYMGNVPPKDAGLPSTCDVSRAMTFEY